jgi:AraC family transcriptional regulator
LRRVMRGKEYIDSYFKTHLDIETIARISSLSEYHFFRVFKNVFGITPHQYIINRRLTYAENLLKKGHRSITLVAHEAGFSDIYSFSKSFKSKFGISPSLIKSGLEIKNR